MELYLYNLAINFHARTRDESTGKSPNTIARIFLVHKPYWRQSDFLELKIIKKNVAAQKSNICHAES